MTSLPNSANYQVRMVIGVREGILLGGGNLP